MASIAIIPARGGSKRIPGKNIKEFLGKPIIAYSIEAALTSGCFDEVMVSTDDPGIAKIAESYDAKVPFLRSAENASDHATTADVILEVLNEYEHSFDKKFATFCCIYPTAPFVIANKLIEAQKLLGDKQVTSVIPVTLFSFPILRSLVIENGQLLFKWPQFHSTRSQDLQPFYHDSGQFYFVKTEAFRQEGKLFTSKTMPLIVAETEVQDIDNETDWAIAEMKYELMQRLWKGK